MRTLIVKFVDETKTVTLPDGATVTFGPSVPAPRARAQNEFGGYEPRSFEYALRIYEGGTAKTPLIGVLTGVRSFHETTVGVKYDIEDAMEPR